MPICTFFGHRHCPESLKPILRKALSELIESGRADTFYVGTHGAFDSLAAQTLLSLQTEYPHIRCFQVLAYLNSAPTYLPTIYPEGIETAPPRFAISWRNKWMLKQATYVITYVNTPYGGAAQFKTLAVKQKKNVIELS